MKKALPVLFVVSSLSIGATALTAQSTPRGPAQSAAAVSAQLRAACAAEEKAMFSDAVNAKDRANLEEFIKGGIANVLPISKKDLEEVFKDPSNSVHSSVSSERHGEDWALCLVGARLKQLGNTLGPAPTSVPKPTTSPTSSPKATVNPPATSPRPTPTARPTPAPTTAPVAELPKQAGTVHVLCTKVTGSTKHPGSPPNESWLTIENGCNEPIQFKYCKTVKTNTNVCDSSGYIWRLDLKATSSNDIYYESQTRSGILFFACKVSEGGRAIRMEAPGSCVFVK